MLKILWTSIRIATIGLCLSACSSDNTASDAQGTAPAQVVTGVCGLTGSDATKAKSACKKACEAKEFDTKSCQKWGFAGGLSVNTHIDYCSDAEFDEEQCRSSCCTKKANGVPLPKICTEILAQSACSVSRKDPSIDLGK